MNRLIDRINRVINTAKQLIKAIEAIKRSENAWVGQLAASEQVDGPKPGGANMPNQGVGTGSGSKTKGCEQLKSPTPGGANGLRVQNQGVLTD